MLSVSEKIGKALNDDKTSLDLSWSRIDPQGVIQVIHHHKNTLKSLDLSYTFCSDIHGFMVNGDGIRVILDYLKHDSTLTHLDLQNSFNNSEILPVVADLLNYNRTLTHINLSCNYIGAQGIGVLSDALKHNRTLTSLNLAQNRIGDKRSGKIAQVLKSNRVLTSLDLSANDIGNEGCVEIADALRHNGTLMDISCGHNHIGVEGAESFAKALKFNRTLRSINVSYNQIGNVGAAAIADALMYNTSLTSLDLTYNDIGLNGARAISEALRGNMTLISFRCDFMGNEGAEEIIARALKENPTISDLHVNFRLADVLSDELSLFEHLLSNNDMLLAHWRMIRAQCKFLIFMGTHPTLGQQTNHSPLYQALASDECYDPNIFRYIFEFSGDLGFGLV